MSGPTQDDSLAVDIRGLNKRFGSTTVLNDLGLQVRKGEVLAFLGPNGAGKTTTLRVLLGLLRSDAGTLSVLGFNPWTHADQLHRRLAYVPGDVSLWPNLTGGEVIDLLMRLRGCQDEPRRLKLIKRFDLDGRKPCRAYSKGNRQKVALIATLACNVDLYVLDEPTSGLDPLMEAAFRDCITELRGQGKTVLLSSHILSEAEALADRITIIRSGRVIETGTMSELRHLTRSTIKAELHSVTDGIRSVAGVSALQIEGHVVQAEVESSALNSFLAELTKGGIRTLHCQPPTLEELFLRHYRAEGR
jgi:ABC-2 type transport system ATP-binding protein